MNMDRDLHGGSSTTLMDQLQALNRDFLELLIVAHRASPEDRTRNLFIPAAVVANLSALSGTALDGVAHCRYTLFSLSFHTTDLWRRLARAPSCSSVERRYHCQDATSSASAIQAASSAFLAVALVFAWYLHYMDRRLARMILGLRDDTAQAFEAIPLWRLHQIAYERPELLSARWPDNPGFWPDLVRIARDGTSAQLDSARLIGAQLIAQELEPSSIRRLSPQRRK